MLDSLSLWPLSGGVYRLKSGTPLYTIFWEKSASTQYDVRQIARSCQNPCTSLKIFPPSCRFKSGFSWISCRAEFSWLNTYVWTPYSNWSLTDCLFAKTFWTPGGCPINGFNLNPFIAFFWNSGSKQIWQDKCSLSYILLYLVRSHILSFNFPGCGPNLEL